MGLFGKLNTRGLPAGRQGKTLLLLDVENGSVGSALVHLADGESPRLFGEMRHALRVLPTRDTGSLLEELRGGIHQVVAHATNLAARLRQHEHTTPMGVFTRAAVYLGAPWGRPDLASGSPAFVGQMQDLVSHELHTLNGPHSFFTATGGVLGGIERTLPDGEPYVLCIVGGEVTEILLVHNHAAAGYATLPLGTHTLVRTMRAHGFTDAEVHSAARLPTGAHQEPLRAAQQQFAEEFETALSQLLRFGAARRVWVVSRGELGEWFARALSASAEVASLFPHGGEVRVLRAAHIVPHLASHAHEPDLLLGLQTLHAQAV